MSKTDKNTVIEETFASKMGIEMVSPKVFEQLIELNAGSRNVVAAVGPSGVGKTAIPSQVAKRRNGGNGVPYVQLHMPTMTQEGFFIPTTAPDTKEYFDQRVPRIFQPLLEWSEAMGKKYKGKKIPKDMVAILAIEELNRAVDKSVTRAAFTLIGDRQIGDVHLPDCIQIVVTMNPTGGGMAVNEFEKDPAMRRRLQPIGVGYSYADFMKYATDACFHPAVLEFLSATPSAGYDDQAALAGKSFACPATWESVSRTCTMLNEAGLEIDSVAGRAAISGSIGTAMATMFLEYVRDKLALVIPEDVLVGYAKNSDVRTRFQRFCADGNGRNDKVSQLIEGLVEKLYQNLARDPETYAAQLSLFMSDLSAEQRYTFMKRLNDASNDKGSDAKSYFNSINAKMAKHPEFQEVMRQYQETAKAIKKELEKAEKKNS